MSLSRGDEYLLGVYQLKLAQKLLLMNEYKKFIEVLRNLKDKPSYPTALFLEGKYHEYLGNF
jgi:hypothetical protein